MIKIVGISGSLRKASFNSALLRACQAMMPSGAELQIHTIAEVPLYNGDVEKDQGFPPSVIRLKDIFASADGILIVTPEYNGSFPGVLKNAIDWMSRPDPDIARVFAGKPLGLMGASTGRSGTRFSQTEWLAVIRHLSMKPWFGKKLYVDSAAQAFNEQGNLVSEPIRGLLAQFLQGYVEFVEKDLFSRQHSL